MEESWGELEELLRKAISRLSISAKGFSPQLDPVLADIQLHCRNKKDDLLNADLENLAGVLRNLEDNPTSASTHPTPTSPNQFALDLVEQLDAPAPQRSALDSLQTQLPSMNHEQSLLAVVALINDLIQTADSDLANPATRVILIDLIERINLTFGSTAQLEKLRQQLEDPEQSHDWHDCLDIIIQQLRDMISSLNDDKAELEGLIVDVSKQLGEISSALNEEHEDSQQGRAETRRLQSVMDENVSGMQQKLHDATDIDKLKTGLNTHLLHIKSGLVEFIEQDDQRFARAEKRNQQLIEQIQTMENESNQLRQKLDENRHKLLHDSLTGVRNRLSYDELLEQEIARYTRYRESFSYALLDIDHFKRINDQYGHNAGDNALRIVAAMMLRNIRQTDFLFRIGGEEFVLLLPKTQIKNATPVVEKIRKSVSQAEFHYKQQKVVVTMSGGLTEMHPDDGAISIYERADEALYKAKRGGRDRLVVNP